MKQLFSLPLRLTVRRCEYWEAVSRNVEETYLSECGQSVLHTSLVEQLGDDGTLVTEHYAAQIGTDAVTVTVMAECLENIGVELPIPQKEPGNIQDIPREEAVND